MSEPTNFHQYLMSIDNSDHEVLKTAAGWLEQDRGVELVTVARTWGSSPRPPGSLAAIRDDGVLVGSVSGGCVEKQLSESFQNTDKSRAFTHRIDDEDARRFGLACGGELELVFETLHHARPLRDILAKLDRRERVKRQVHVGDQAASLIPADRGDMFSWDGQTLEQVFGPAWRVLIIGAGQLSRYTAEFALALDFEVVVCEPRPEFRQAWQVSGAELIELLPDDAVLKHAMDPQSAVLALTHDPNLDDLALLEALPGQAFYVGALGSKRNYERRCKRLVDLDVAEESVARLRGPVGLSIGSRTSAEIAISIVAELVQVKRSL